MITTPWLKGRLRGQERERMNLPLRHEYRHAEVPESAAGAEAARERDGSGAAALRYRLLTGPTSRRPSAARSSDRPAGSRANGRTPSTNRSSLQRPAGGRTLATGAARSSVKRTNERQRQQGGDRSLELLASAMSKSDWRQERKKRNFAGSSLSAEPTCRTLRAWRHHDGATDDCRALAPHLRQTKHSAHN